MSAPDLPEAVEALRGLLAAVNALGLAGERAALIREGASRAQRIIGAYDAERARRLFLQSQGALGIEEHR